jgi:SAM-dependent methyltransferase
MANHGPKSAKFDERYSEPGYHYGTEPTDFIAAQKDRLQPGQRVLVPGDGEGRHGVWLAEQGLDVRSFDPSPVGVEKAKRLAAERGVELDARVGDFESWDWEPAAYDAVVLTYVHVDPAVRREAHAGVWRTLRPGGLVIFEGFSPRQFEMRKHGATGGPKDFDWLFSEDMMREDFPGAEFLLLEDVDEDYEGRTHSGHCAVLHMIARKPRGE